MAEIIGPPIFAAFAWWLSTGVVIHLVHSPARRYAAIAWGATAMCAAAMGAAWLLRDAATPLGAYAGFLIGVALWAWHEILFLLGYLGGPNKSPCPRHETVWRRFLASSLTLIHHEIVIAFHALAITALVWGADNQTAAWTF